MIKKTSLFSGIVTLLAIIGSVAIVNAQEKKSSIELELMWTLDGFDRPESVAPSADCGEIYVTSVDGATSEEDGNGYISRLSTDGKMIEKKWITGLDAPKGFDLKDGKIYVTDINDLVIVDIATKQIVERIPVPDAAFLNDVAVVNGDVFFSDSGAATLYRYNEDDGLSKFIEGDVMARINGLLADGDNLLVAVMQAGQLLSVDLDTKATTVLGSGIVNGDGIGKLPSGGHIVTAYSGEIYHIKNDQETDLLLDSKPDNISQNDAYLVGDMFYVANMNSDKVTAWKVVPIN